MNNCDGHFSSSLYIGHITGDSVLWLVCNIPTLLHKAIKTEVILSCGWPPLAHMSRACRGMQWVMVLVQSTQLNFPFKAYLNSHLNTCLYLGLTGDILYIFSNGEVYENRRVLGYCRCQYVDISWYILLPQNYFFTLVGNKHGSLVSEYSS